MSKMIEPVTKCRRCGQITTQEAVEACCLDTKYLYKHACSSAIEPPVYFGISDWIGYNAVLDQGEKS